MVTSLILLTLLAQDAGSGGDYRTPSDSSTWSTPASPAPAPSRQTKFRGAFEASVLSLPSGTPGGSIDVFGMALPILAVDSGEDFGFELGAELRLRAFDEPPLQREEDVRGVLRGRDWDEASDFGQIVRHVRVGSEEGPIFFRAGRAELKTVGHGHLISRYNNQGSPDYHPAAGWLTFTVGPARTELFASDILAGRILAGEVNLDVARLVTEDPSHWDRYHFAMSAAHDFGQGGYAAPQITLLQVDADAAIHKVEEVQVFGYLGAGTRLFGAAPQVGAVAGVAADGVVEGVTVGGRLEGRKLGGGFRYGMFGPAYELSRFSGTGLAVQAVAYEELPDSFSGYVEVEVGYGPEEASPAGEPRIFASLAAEYFAWGRVDGDVAIAARFPGNKGTATARFTLVNELQGAPRYQGSAEVRYRFTPALYVIATGGTVFFPQPGASALVRGAFGSIGIGADFER